MLIPAIDPADPRPAYRQLVRQVTRLVDDGVLHPGARLPPTRRLAELVGVHRSTAVRAYRELRALGYLESRPGSYSTVRRRLRPPGARADVPPAAPTSEPPVPAPPVAPAAGSPADSVIDLASHLADPALAPHDYLRRSVKRVLAGPERDLLARYPDPRGLPRLREVIARRMATHGIAASDAGILVTNGTQHALDLIFRLLLRAGDEAVVEAPSYSMVLTLLRLHRARVVSVRMRDDGLDLDQLRRLLARRRPRLLYTMPNFQNPTGLTTAQPHREALLAASEAHGVPVLEDGFDEELKYSGAAVLPIKAIDRHGLVFYLGTLSKIVFPGLRIGWIVAPPAAIDRLGEIQRASNLGGNVLAQAVAARFMGGEEFDGYLRRAHRVLRRRLQVALAELATHLPPRVRWTRPEGGYTVWLTVDGAPGQEAALYQRILRAGVKVEPGHRAFARRQPVPHFRLSIACVGEEQIAEACRRLGRALG